MKKAGTKDLQSLRPAKVLLTEELTKNILDLIKKSKHSRGEKIPDGKSKKSNSNKTFDNDDKPHMNEKAIERQNRRLLRVLIRESIQTAVIEDRQSRELEMKNHLTRATAADNNSTTHTSKCSNLSSKDQNNEKSPNDSISMSIRASVDLSKLSPKVRITFQNEKNKVKSKVCVFTRAGTTLEELVKEACTKLKITKNKEKKVAWLFMDDISSKLKTNNNENGRDSNCVRRVIIQQDISYFQNDTTLILSLRPKEDVLKEFYNPVGKSKIEENTSDQQKQERGKIKKEKKTLKHDYDISSLHPNDNNQNDNDDQDDTDPFLTEEEVWKNQQDSMRKAYDENRERKTNRISANSSFPKDFSTKFLHERIKNQSTNKIVKKDMIDLPAHKKRHAIVQAINTSRISIIKGAAGSGKTTQIPQFILDDCVDRFKDCFILCCQPRRVAAIGVAERISYERNENCGETIGYNVRFDTKLSNQTRILFLTTGMLLNRMLDDPTLNGVTHLILDEVHERSLHMDFLLTLAKHHIRRNIKIILMSATLDVESFSHYFRNVNYVDKIQHLPINLSKSNTHIHNEEIDKSNSTDDSNFDNNDIFTKNIPVVSIEGRTFPVKLNWLCHVETLLNGKGFKNKNMKKPGHIHQKVHEGNNNDVMISPEVDLKSEQVDPCIVANLVEAIATKWFRAMDSATVNVKKQEQKIKPCILIFLPGAQEIDLCIQKLEGISSIKQKILCLPLHGQLQPFQQKRVFHDYSNRQEVVIIVATNVAETSITVPGITDVIDCGQMKETRYNPTTRMQSLVTVWVSHANAIQRAGRAGRVLAGTCWRLYSEEFYKSQLPFQSECEMKRAPLDNLILFLALSLSARKRNLLNFPTDSDHNDTNESLKKNGSIGKEEQKDDILLYEDIPLFFRQSPEPPLMRSVLSAQKRLIELGAFKLSRNYESIEKSKLFLTPLGYHIANLPMDPNIAKMLLYGCVLGCRDITLTIAAALSSRSPFLNLKNIHDNERKSEIEQLRKAKCMKNHNSDHFAICEAFNAWNQSNAKGKKELCKELNLSTFALNEIKQLRASFDKNLNEIGLRKNYSAMECTSKQITQQISSERSNESAYFMAKCALTAGLYPNVVQIQKDRVMTTLGNHKKNSIKTKVKTTLVSLQQDTLTSPDTPQIHPSSFNYQNVKNLSANDGWLLYHRKMKTSQLYLFDTSLVNSIHLILFGGSGPPKLSLDKPKKKFKKDSSTFQLGTMLLPLDHKNYLTFTSKNEHAVVLVRALRNEIDNLFIEKIRNPSKPLGELGDLVIKNIYYLTKDTLVD